MQAWSEGIGVGIDNLHARMRMFVHLCQDLERVRCRLGLRGEGFGDVGL